jgi:hypothetical protein
MGDTYEMYVLSSPDKFPAYVITAIEHIKGLGHAHEQQRAELYRLRPEAEYCRRAQEELQIMREELVTVWQHLRQADPSSAHIYGRVTNALAHESAPTPAPGVNNILPPIQQQQQQQHPPPPQPQHHVQAQQWATPAPTAMQGVEFGGMRPYEHPHR